ncbi:MAG: DUF3854 domain-containing protein [Acaryochloridaceae cyanobacterium RL_2_7]|nr:DUF3854 domain-containing protein [Acaryochloridaceae cyanobacterium RL_2_7]
MTFAIPQSRGEQPLGLESIFYTQFSEKFRQECIEGSAIAPSLFDTAISFHSDVETDFGGEVRYPIHEALNWRVTRFGHQARETLEGAFFQNFDGSTWQLKLNNPLWDRKKQKTRKYESPAGGGSKPYFPLVPQEIVDEIASKSGLDAPHPKAFWDWVSENPSLPIVITEGGKKRLVPPVPWLCGACPIREGWRLYQQRSTREPDPTPSHS